MALDSVIVNRGGVSFTVNAVNLSELSMILQICSRAPQLPVLCELSLRLSLLLLTPTPSWRSRVIYPHISHAVLGFLSGWEITPS